MSIQESTAAPATGFRVTARREFRRMCSRRMYICAMVLVPLAVLYFFITLLDTGLPTELPSAIVDLDHTPMSREVTRNIDATELVHITCTAESYDEALAAVRRGEVFGFFIIPANFQSDALAMRTPTLSYYTNMTYFVPGTLAFKGFKTIAVTTSGGVVRTALRDLGMDASAGLLQPVNIKNFCLGNPWMNYSYYLTPSFGIGTLALMIMLMTVFSITMEIKSGTSRQWLSTAGNRISTALLGKMLPHTLVYIAVGSMMLWMMLGWRHFPMNGSSVWPVWFAMVLFVIASQALALVIVSAIPNPRLAFSITALFGILTFSFAGFSFPVQNMYGAIGVFSWFAPTRYLFLIYINDCLNGYSTWFVRWWYVALLAFPFVGALLTPRLKKALLNPVYVP